MKEMMKGIYMLCLVLCVLCVCVCMYELECACVLLIVYGSGDDVVDVCSLNVKITSCVDRGYAERVDDAS